MSTSLVIVLVLTFLLAGLDWFAVASDNDRLERLAKPAVMVALVLLVLLSDLDGWPLVWVLVALIAALIGDVMLLPTIDRFVVGLGSFLIGHVAYAGLGLWVGTSTGWLIVGLVSMSLAIVTVGTKISDSVQGTALFSPVVAYIVALALSSALLIATGEPLFIAGALLFGSSDALLGWSRFIDDAPGGRLAVHVSYHLAQIALVVGAVTVIT